MAQTAQNSTAVYQRPWLYEKQKEAIFDSARYSLIEASTKSGKTVGCLFWIVEQAVKGRAGQQFWWIAPTYRQTKIAYRRLKQGMTKKEVFISNESDLTISLINGTQIVFLTAEKPDNLYGEDVVAAVIDEASRIREAAWHAIRTTITATKGKVRIIGNVKGRKNWFYKMCRKAEAGEPHMAYHRLTWIDAVSAAILDRDEIEDAERQLPEAVFRELYNAEASDDEGNPFGYKHIKQCVAPLSAKRPVVWGWDLAKKHDWTVGIALDEDGQVCRFLRFQKSWSDTIKTILAESGSCKSLVDSTGVGDPIVEQLQEHHSNFEGYLFSSTSKQRLMEGLALAIQSQSVTILEGPMLDEVESFEYEYTRTGVRYSAPEGMFDDCVCSLSLAVEALRRPIFTWGVVEDEEIVDEKPEQRFYALGSL